MMIRRMIFSALAALMLVTGWTGAAEAQQQQACYIGRDQNGAQMILRLVSERYGDYYEIYGQLISQSFGTMQVKADGWSGAGRMFRGQEGEAGALYIQISDYTGTALVLGVEGYGRFPFQQTGC
ncbi:MAG: hypothetical protein V3R73_02130 [Sphingomonadales bacterium]